MNQALRRHSLLLGPWLVMAAALGGLAIAAPARAQQLVYKSPSDPALPQAGFFLGLGGSYNSVNFGTQNVYAVGTSDVYQGGVLASTGSASGPANIYMGSEFTFAPAVQAGYFQKFTDSNWLWGAKFSYSYLNATSTVTNALLPQTGTTTPVGGSPTTFTGTAVARTYQTNIEHQIALIPLIGRSFDKSFVYIGAGPTLSRTRTNVNGLVGFANVIGVPTNISGAPTDVSGAGWVFGGSAVVGATYFLSRSWFLDFSYSYAMTGNQTFNYSSPFSNPNGVLGTTINGMLVGNSTGKVITQGVSASINKVF